VQFSNLISKELGISEKSIQNTLTLIEEGCTTPFIARYRKERTNGLDEVAIEQIRKKFNHYVDLDKRKKSILESIDSQGQLTPALRQQIESSWDATAIEDLYLPFKPKRRTRATVAREKGLEPLAHWLMHEHIGSPEQEARRYIHKDVANPEEALSGARDIVADIINEDVVSRNLVRKHFQRDAQITSKVVKSKKDEGAKYSDYFQFSEPLQRCPSHRVLALLRGEDEGFLKLNIAPDSERCIAQLKDKFIRKRTPSSQQLHMAIEDAYDRLLAPSMETETRQAIKAKADQEAIRIFANNAQQLLLAPALGMKRILAIDPGFRTGCKVVCLDSSGDLLNDTVIYPHEPQMQTDAAGHSIRNLVQRYSIESIAIGDGTAGRETERFIRRLNLDSAITIYMVNENGASIYSASEIAREEFPNHDITVRGAVSIGRRLADPLAELVKIDPKSIGVGQYQHDVDQHLLKSGLDTVVEHCVNKVGVNLNTASKSLLTYVSGLNSAVAQNIVQYRTQNGAFHSRQSLKKVPRLGDKTFEQCAAFLRIPEAKHPLDNSAVHPESYSIVERMAKDLNCTIPDLLHDEKLRKQIIAERYITPEAGLPTIQDILQELAKPGRDPRGPLEAFEFADVTTVDDLSEGMTLPGIVTNITKFGCFVDIGVKQDGMIHISQMANRYVADPNDIVQLRQAVQVQVLEVDKIRKRIGLKLVQNK
jgi:protein Tex